MKILYDGHMFRWQTYGGISRYFSELVSRLPADWEPVFLGVDRNLPRHPQLQSSPVSSIRPRRFTQPLKVSYWRLRHFRNAQIFHPTYYHLMGGLRYTDVKGALVITVHDMIHWRYRDFMEDAERTVKTQRDAVIRADRVICVSRATEEDLIDCIPEAAGKTCVIHHGSSFPVQRSQPSIAALERPMFLFVGGRGSYKNFLFLLRAFADACQLCPTICLHIAGPALSPEEHWQLHFLGIADRIQATTYPDEATLRSLYQTSVALLYPSCHEGFGIPVLEAMACGAIAVTSNTTSLPEVVGDAGIMLDPTDQSAWTDCIVQIASGGLDRQLIIERGEKRVRTFSWETSAATHVELYRQLA
jgi:glycosyltransferase involved in cell wall biosynthesis